MYDGDQLTVKSVFSQEANKECEEKMNSLSYLLDIQGRNIRNSSNEVIQSAYQLTRRDEGALTHFKQISDQEKKYLLSLDKDKIDFKLFEKLFVTTCTKNAEGKVISNKPMFNTADWFILKPGEYFNKKEENTSVGMFIFNKFLVEGQKYQDILGYVNTTLRSGALKDINNSLSKAALYQKIGVQDYKVYLDKSQRFLMRIHSSICSSFTLKTFNPIPEVVEKRKELCKKYEKELAVGDVITMANIEKETVELAKQKLQGDPGLLLYDSGARGSFGGNYKEMCVTRGPINNPLTGKADIVQKSLMEGIDKKDIPAMANAVVLGAYPKAVGTGVAGYFSKQILAALQADSMDMNTFDCGTKYTLDVKITKDNYNLFEMRYINENGKIVELIDDNIKSYIGKTVKLRTVLGCKNNKKCQCCIGEIYKKLGVEHVGLTASKPSATVLNLGMKKFHDSTVKLGKINISDITL